MTRVQVVRDDQAFTGEVTGSDKIPNPAGGLQDRLTVKRDDTGTLEYVLPETVDRVQQIDIQPVAVAPGVSPVLGGTPAQPAVPGLEHLAPSLAPPPGMVPSDPSVQVVGSMTPSVASAPVVGPAIGGAPPVGSSFGGVPMAPPVGQPVAPPPPLAPPSRPRPERFMVQPKKGKPTRYHTREDCSNVTDGSPRKEVTDEDIEFFGLEHCASCSRRDAQISWKEAIREGIMTIPGATDEMAQAAVASIQSNGFRVTPEVVDR